MFGLLDCNNFYVSCERVFRPDLRDKPAIVLSNNDGCVIARSNEAKALGIKMGVPVYQIEELIKEHQIKIFSSNYTLYGDMSARVMSILAAETPEIEIYSIDESFLNLTGIPNLEKFGRTLVQKITRCTGIPVSLGIAPTKTLAKTANKFAKKYKGYQGCCLIDNESKRIAALQKTNIGDIWGIGRRLAAKLESRGIFTAYDFTRLPARQVRSMMTVTGERLWRELNGEKCLTLENEEEEKKQICNSRSFGETVSALEELESAVALHALRCAEKLRSQNTAAEAVTTFIMTNRFRQDLPQYCNQFTVSLPLAGNDSLEIARAALKALKQIFKPGYAYKKCGVIIPAIIPHRALQGDLFTKRNVLKSANLMAAIDKLNNQNPGCVDLAVMHCKHRPSLKKDFISRHFTTNFNEILTIKV